MNMVICADDFGMTEDINRATAELARAGKNDAVSCMVNRPFFTSGELLGLGTVQLGLHFTLAETLQEFRHLVRNAYMRRLNRQDLCAELLTQYKRFEEVAGRRPAFIDGHMHIQ